MGPTNRRAQSCLRSSTAAASAFLFPSFFLIRKFFWLVLSLLPCPYPMALQLTDYVLRPGSGKVGRPVRVRSNFFEVLSFPTKNLYHYDVSIDPSSAPPALYRRVWKAFENIGGQGLLRTIRPVYDGRKNVFAPEKLPLGPEGAAQYEVSVALWAFFFKCATTQAALTTSGNSFRWNCKTKKVVSNAQLASSSSGSSTSVKFTWMNFECSLTEKQRLATTVWHVSLNVLHIDIRHRLLTYKSLYTGIMVLDVLIRHMPSMMYATVGRSFFTPQDKRPLPNAAEVWQGFYQSARPACGRMMINIDVSATAFYESGPLHDLAAKILNRRSVDELRRGLSERDRIKLEKSVKGLKVTLIHRKDTQRKYKILRVTPSSADRTVFKDDQTGTEQTVPQYFQERYNRRLAFSFLPCVVLRGGKREQFLPMELCQVVPAQRFMKKLNEKQTAEMIKFTCQKPSVRANKINDGFQLLKYKDNEYMQQFGMTVKPEMTIVDARVLPTPQISYNPSSADGVFQPQNGAWNLRGKKVAHGATLGSWAVVNFMTILAVPVIQKFIRELCTTFIDTGLVSEQALQKKKMIVYIYVLVSLHRLYRPCWIDSLQSQRMIHKVASTEL